MARQWPFFGKKQPEPEPEPVRPDQVQRLANLLAQEDDAILFDAPGSPFYAQVRGLLAAAMRNSTDAERRAAEALRNKEHQAGPDNDLRRPSTPTPPPPPEPTTSSDRTPTTTTGETAMASIDEIRAAIAEIQQRGETAAQQLLQVREDLQGMTQLLMQITQGSSDSDVAEAVGQLRAVGDDLDEIPSRIDAATSAAAAYGGRL